MLALILIIWTLFVPCEHRTTMERFEAARITPAAKITNYDGINVDYVIETKEEVRAGTVRLMKETTLPKNFSSDYKKHKYYLIYCITHGTVYELVEQLEK